MSKRKRDDDDTEEIPEKAPEAVVADPKQKRLQLKLHQGTVKLGHAFKVAKGFERQKLGRRQKTAAAAKNEKDAQRVETEIAALKVREYMGEGRGLQNGNKLTGMWKIGTRYHCSSTTPPIQMSIEDQSCRELTTTRS
jgi:hypothetical protein